MFKGCKLLKNIPDISIWNTHNVTCMSYMFAFGYEEYSSYKNFTSSITSLPDISKWDTGNVTEMFDMFGGCSSLISFPDLSNWNTQKITSSFLTTFRLDSKFYGKEPKFKYIKYD